MLVISPEPVEVVRPQAVRRTRAMTRAARVGSR